MEIVVKKLKEVNCFKITLFLIKLIFVLTATITPGQAVMDGKPSYTAEMTTAYRAIAAKDPDEKIRNPDSLAEKFVSEEFWFYTYYSRDYAASMRWIKKYKIATYYYVNARTKHIDALVKKAVKNGVTQIVNLGAGLDSRAYRFRDEMPDVIFFEMDLPAVIAQKQQRLQEIFGSIPPYVAYVPIDFNKQSIEKELKKAGYDPKKKTFFIWEGVTYYITANAVESTLNFIADSSCSGSTVVFDYIPEEAFGGDETKYPGYKRYAGFVRVKGEPFVFGIPGNNAEGYVKERGFKSLSDLGPADLVKKYLIRSDGTVDGRPNSFFRIIHAQVP